MKAISFLGTGEYKTVTYCWQGRECQTNLFPEAIARTFEPEKLFVLVTPTAKEHEHFKTLRERLSDLVQPVDIPEGRSETELWRIFEQCAEIVNEGDEVLLDITHAFRSLPLIVFAVAAYLRRTKNVTISRIVYGAFEARDEQNRAPIFDLTPLLDLLDWLSGAEFLMRRSDATLLAEQLRQTHQRMWRERTEEELPKKLQSLGNSLSNLSQALHLARPRDVMKAAQGLLRLLDEVKPEVERWAKPFGVVLEQVKAEAERLAHDTPDQLDIGNLQKQLALIEHYLDKGLTMQAVTLAREWIVSLVALKRGEGDWLKKEDREEVEEALGAAAASLRGEQADIPDWFERLSQNREVAKLWNWLIGLRNDLAHCGMRMGKDAANIGSIHQKAKKKKFRKSCEHSWRMSLTEFYLAVVSSLT
ncbi:MAG: TIGR02221 family CRISPR-associated protein [Armatimonadota bacterium]